MAIENPPNFRDLMRFLAVLLSVGALACAGPGHDEPGTPEEPTVTLTRTTPRAIGLIEQEIELGLRIENPNEFALEVVGIRYALELSGAPVARGSESLQLVIPAFATEELTVASRASTADLVQGVARTSEHEAVSYEIRGTLLLDQPEARALDFHHASDRLDLD